MYSRRYEYFSSHKLNEKGRGNAELIRCLFDGLLNELDKLCKEGREFSLTKTKLEEASFYAKKAMAIDEANQLKEEE